MRRRARSSTAGLRDHESQPARDRGCDAIGLGAHARALRKPEQLVVLLAVAQRLEPQRRHDAVDADVRARVDELPVAGDRGLPSLSPSGATVHGSPPPKASMRQ